MNKKGAIFMSIVIGLFIYVSGILFLPFLMDDITSFRSAMDCSNSSITDGVKVTCLLTDTIVPYVVWLFVSMALGYIIGGRI